MKKTKKVTQTEKIMLSSLGFEKVQIDCVQSEEYFNLSDSLKGTLDLLCKEYKWDIENQNIYYSLGYSQGDGAMFEGTVTTEKGVFTVSHYGHYYHYNSNNMEFDSVIIKGTAIDVNDYVDIKANSYKYFLDTYDYDLIIYLTIKKENESIDDIFKDFENDYVDICKKLERAGYEYIAFEDEENALFKAWDNFKAINNLNVDLELYDLEYSSKKVDGYLHIGIQGASILDLYIKDIELTKNVYTTIVTDAIEYI